MREHSRATAGHTGSKEEKATRVEILVFEEKLGSGVQGKGSSRLCL